MEVNKEQGTLSPDRVMDQRSEKVRMMAGAIPRRLLGAALAVMLFIILALIAAVAFIPYPYSEGESILRHILQLSI